MRRKEEGSNQGQTINKAKQHSTPTAVTFPTCTCIYIYNSTDSMQTVQYVTTIMYNYTILPQAHV